MKHLLIIASLSLSLTSIAQTTDSTQTTKPAAVPAATDSVHVAIAAPAIKIETQGEPMSVVILQANVKDTQKDWAKYVGKDSKGKSEMVNGQFTQYGALVKNISPDPINITTKLLGTTDGVRLSVWLSDNNNFQNSKGNAGDRTIALEKYVHDFAVLEYKEVVSAELKKEQQKQASLERDLNKMIKDEERATKQISDDKRGIERDNDKIATSKADVQNSSTQIEAQKGMVQSNAGDKNASKGAQKTLNGMERDKKSTQNQGDRDGKNIDSRNKAIRANEKLIADTKDKEVSKTAEIEKQKIVVAAVKAKLDAIK